MAGGRRPGLRALVANWRRSPLPFWRRLALALGNLWRRLAWPPRNCCGRYGQPGC